MNLRKKINLKGLLLALAVSIPPLISTTTFTVPIESKNQSVGLFDSQTDTSLSEPYVSNNKNLSIVNYDLTQEVPFKVSISNIKPFKWVNYRTRTQIEAQIQELIALNTGQEPVELNKDYEIIFTTNPAPDQVVPIQTVKIRAMANSQYLTGEFSFQIIAPLKLANNRSSYNRAIPQNPFQEELIKNVVKDDIHAEMVRQNIDESTSDLLSLLNVVPTNVTNGSTLYKLKHNGEFYYNKIVFQFAPNKLFSSDLITWNNVVAPVYSSFELPSVYVNQAYSLSFVDSTSDRNYPHAKDSNVYINAEHDPARKAIQYSPTITFAEINVKQLFNFSSIAEFFTVYKLRFNYQFKLNTWTSDWGWNHPGGKEVAWSYDENTWDTNTDLIGEIWSLGKDLSSGRKAYAAVRVWIDLYPLSSTIKIKGDASSAFNWKNGSAIHHAAFGLLTGNTIEFIRK